jgi:hypothetical protein
LGRKRGYNPGIVDTKVTCNYCDNEKWISFNDALQKGWPACCGYTMEMTDTQADIEEEMDKVLAKKKVRLRSKYSERRYIP